MNFYDNLKLKYLFSHTSDEGKSIILDTSKLVAGKHRKKRKGESENKEFYYLENPPLGINKFEFIPSDNSLIMEISSKILLDRYKELISKDNFDFVIDKINSLGIIKIDHENFISNARVLSAHVTQDIPISRSYNHYAEAFMRAEYRNGFAPQDKYKYSGVFIFKPANKKNPVNLKIYNKHDALIKDKNKKGSLILRHINLDDFKNKIRIEGELKTFAALRKFLDLPDIIDPMLEDVLNSDARTLADLIEYVLPDKSISRTYSSSKSTLSKAGIDILFSEIYSDSKGDLKTAIDILKRKFSKNPYNSIYKYKSWATAKKYIKPGFAQPEIQEILTQLKK